MALDRTLDTIAIGDILALASDVVNGCALAVVAPDGRVLAGRLPDEPPAAHQVHAVVVDGTAAGLVVAGPTGSKALLALVAQTLELAAGAAHEAEARTRLAEELAIGRRIQRSLIPSRFPDVGGWTFAAAYEAAREVGGDLYDAFALRAWPDQFALLVADVTGKGIPAALLMADVRALLHAAVDNVGGPAEALTRVNRILVDERATSLFVTAVLVVVDAVSGRIRYASAGHEPPLVAHARGGLVELPGGGPLLGAFGDAVFEERSWLLERGDALVLYTDGVTETRDTARAFYGEERLFATLDGVCGRPASLLVDAVMDGVRTFRGDAEPFDDLTLLVAERDPA